jgi:hypothetical protein
MIGQSPVEKIGYGASFCLGRMAAVGGDRYSKYIIILMVNHVMFSWWMSNLASFCNLGVMQARLKVTPCLHSSATCYCEESRIEIRSGHVAAGSKRQDLEVTPSTP